MWALEFNYLFLSLPNCVILTNYLMSLCLSLFICKMGVITVISTQMCGLCGLNKNVYNMLSRVVDILQVLVDTIFQEFELSVGRGNNSGL